MNNCGWFARFANKAAALTGHPATCGAAAGVIVLWAAAGPFTGFSDVWQLTINTGTTIITFLMVFLIQNTQNRDSAAVHLKLDELIRATQGARNKLLDLEDRSEAELKLLRSEYAALAGKDTAGAAGDTQLVG